MRRPFLAFAALGLALAASPAFAIDDHVEVRVSAFDGDGRLRVAGNTTYQDAPESYDETFDTGRSTVPAVDARWHFGDRHRLVFGYTRFDNDEDALLDEAISFDDVTIPAGSTARGEAKLEFASLAYDFAVVETPTVSWGLQLGVQDARVRGRIRAVAGADVYDRSDSESGALPIIGTRLTLAPSSNWRFDAQVQHVDASWFNSDDLEGQFTTAHALAEYRFGGRFGIHAGYKWMRLNLHDRSEDEGVNRFDQRFNGPVVGLTVAF